MTAMVPRTLLSAVVAGVFVLLCAGASRNSPLVYLDRSMPIEKRVADLLARMTVEEKIGQMNLWWSGKDPEAERGEPGGAKRAVVEGLPALTGATRPVGILFGFAQRMTPDPKRQTELRNEVHALAIKSSRLEIPVLSIEEGTHGVGVPGASMFPQPIALGSTWDVDLVHEIGEAIGEEARTLGVHQLCTSPVLDVYRDPRLGRVEQGYSEDPYMVSRMGVAQTKGIQGRGVAVTLSHFAGQGEARRGIERGPAEISERTFREVCLRPYEAAVKEAGALSVMAGYNEVGGIPCHGNHELLTNTLRGEWGFQGYVISDSEGVEMLHNEHFVASSMQEAGRQAVEAGVDCNFPNSHAFGDLMLKNVKEQKVSMATIDRAAGRILRAKFQLGLFDNPPPDPARAVSIVNSRRHRELALRSARKSIVLLKNDRNLLPLQKDVKSILVAGPNADDGVNLLGGYTPHPPGIEVTTVLQAVRRKVTPETTVRYAKGCDVLDGSRDGFRQAVEEAKKSDLAIVVLGDSIRTATEARDRADLNFPGLQLDLLKAIHATGIPVVLIATSGRPTSMIWEAAHVPAILQAFYPGEEGGNAIADVLFGDYNPGGRLAFTLPRSAGQMQTGVYEKPTPTRKYVDEASTPLFEFGYGLSYTTFAYSDLKLSPAKIHKSGNIHVSVEVKNTGPRKGDEVVALYVRDLYSSVTRPVRMLNGFRRITLEPGEKKLVEFDLPVDQLALYDRQMRRVVEPGDFTVTIGGLHERFTVVDN